MFCPQRGTGFSLSVVNRQVKTESSDSYVINWRHSPTFSLRNTSDQRPVPQLQHTVVDAATFLPTCVPSALHCSSPTPFGTSPLSVCTHTVRVRGYGSNGLADSPPRARRVWSPGGWRVKGGSSLITIVSVELLGFLSGFLAAAHPTYLIALRQLRRLPLRRSPPLSLIIEGAGDTVWDCCCAAANQER